MRSFKYHAASLDHEDALRHTAGGLKVMGHDDLGHVLGFQFEDKPCNQAGIDRIQASGRFVIENHLCATGHCSRDAGALSHAAAQFSRHFLQHIIKPDKSQTFLDDLLNVVLGHRATFP